MILTYIYTTFASIPTGCGEGTYWDSNIEYCIADPESSGFDGTTFPPDFDPGCSVRVCCEHACCGEGTQYSHDLACCIPILPSQPSPNPTSAPTLSPTITAGLQESCNIVDDTKFNICLDFVSTSGLLTAIWVDAFEDARLRWESIITGDLPPLSSAGFEKSDPRCSTYPDVIDDLYICAIETPIDGIGEVIGLAAVDLARNIEIAGKSQYTALTGLMIFDSADILDLMNEGTWGDTILHEMAHVLGFGTLWNYGSNDLYSNGTVFGVFKGPNAVREWEVVGCAANSPNPLGVPVELGGGEGTKDSHWAERCFKDELMAPYLSGLPQSISRITVGSLEDLGYTVDYGKADPFDVNPNDCGCSGGIRLLQSNGREQSPQISPEGIQNIIDYVQKEFESIEAGVPPPISDPDSAVDLVTKTVVVAYKENGEIFFVGVPLRVSPLDVVR